MTDISRREWKREVFVGHIDKLLCSRYLDKIISRERNMPSSDHISFVVRREASGSKGKAHQPIISDSFVPLSSVEQTTIHDFASLVPVIESIQRVDCPGKCSGSNSL